MESLLNKDLSQYTDEQIVERMNEIKDIAKEFEDLLDEMMCREHYREKEYDPRDEWPEPLP